MAWLIVVWFCIAIGGGLAMIVFALVRFDERSSPRLVYRGLSVLVLVASIGLMISPWNGGVMRFTEAIFLVSSVYLLVVSLVRSPTKRSH